MASYKKRLKLKQPYRTILTVLITWILTIAIVFFISWRIDQVSKQTDQKHGSINLVK